MSTRSPLRHLLFTGICLLPILYLLITWNKIPAKVPTHFNASMKPDSYSSKAGFFVIELFISFLAVGLYFLLQNIHKLDPRRATQPKSPVYDKIAIGMVVFMTALSFVTIQMSLGKATSAGKLLLPLIGLLFAFLGNLMHNVKPNYFVGLRLPWTLSSDYNWRKTHQLASKLWFGGGLLLALLSLLLPPEISAFTMMGIVAIIVLVPVIYSYSIFKKEQKEGNTGAREIENNK